MDNLTSSTLTVRLATEQDLFRLFQREGIQRKGPGMVLSGGALRRFVVFSSVLKELVTKTEQQTGGRVTRVYYKDGKVQCDVAN